MKDTLTGDGELVNLTRSGVNRLAKWVHTSVSRGERLRFPDGSLTTIRYYDEKERESWEGKRLARRPKSLPLFAGALVNGYWEHGRYAPTGEPIGLWQYYQPDGILTDEFDFGGIEATTCFRTSLWSSGRIRFTGSYEIRDRKYPAYSGPPRGVFKMYAEDGTFEGERDVTGDSFKGSDDDQLHWLVTTKHRVPTGARLKSIYWWELVEGERTRYWLTYPSGVIRADAELVGEVSVGTWRFYAPSEELLTSIDPTVSPWREHAAWSMLDSLWLYAVATAAPMNEVRERASTIDWAKQSFAFEVIPERVPAIVGALVSTDIQLRGDALNYLWCRIVHQATYYSAAKALAPILEDLTQDPRAEGERIKKLLSQLPARAMRPVRNKNTR